jgi:hypothetical protein
VKAAQRGGQVEGDDRGADSNLEGERRKRQCNRRPHGALMPVPGEQGEQTDDDQGSNQGGCAAMKELDRGRPLEGKAESAAAERPRATGSARAAPHH